MSVGSKTKAIVTFVNGKHYEQLFAITGPRIESYAERIGAELHVIEARTGSREHVLTNKMRASALFRKYERSLYVDSDVFIRESSPSIFDEVPRGKLGAVNELVHLADSPKKPRNQLIASVLKSQGAKRCVVRPYINAGVFVIDQEHGHLYDPPARPLPKAWCSEQALFSYRISRHRVPFHELGLEWNCMFNCRAFRAKQHSAHFIHLNGCKPIERRVTAMEELERLGHVA